MGLSGDSGSVDVVSARAARIETYENNIGVQVPWLLRRSVPCRSLRLGFRIQFLKGVLEQQV